MKRFTKYLILLILISSTLSSCSNDVLEELPVADFSIGLDTVLISTEVVFENSSELANSYEWDFGDGFVSTEISPTHQYSSGGSFTVSLTAFSSGGEVTKTKTIVVEEPNKYLIQNNSPFTLYNLKSYTVVDDVVTEVIEHGTLSSGTQSAQILTGNQKINISFENGQGYMLTVIFPFDIEENTINLLEIKKYTMVYIDAIDDGSKKNEKSSISAKTEISKLF